MRAWYVSNMQSFLSVSLKYCSVNIDKTLLMHKVCITKRPTKRDISGNLEDLTWKSLMTPRVWWELSQCTACHQKGRCDQIVDLCILLKGLSYPYRFKDMAPLYGQNPTELCLIFNEILNFIDQRHHHRLDSWNLILLQPLYL